MIQPLSRRGKTVFGVINAAGVAVFLVAAALTVTQSPPLPWEYPALFFVALGCGLVVLKIPGISSIVSLADVFVFLAAMLFGPAPAVLIAGTEAFVSTRRHSPRLLSAFSSLSVMSLATAVSAQVFYVARGPAPAASDDSTAALGLSALAMAFAQYLVNTWLVAALTAQARRRPVRTVWRENYAGLALTYAASAGSACLVVAFGEGRGTPALAVALVLVTTVYFTYRVYLGRAAAQHAKLAALNGVHLRTIEALAMAADARGQASFGHLPRVQAYSVWLATLAGADADTVDAVRTAALLHDVGKIAIPDYILNKPGRLSAPELKKMRTYPRIGAEILRSVEFPNGVVPIVAAHREAWDGSGYPDGLKDEAIPLGARVLNLAESIEAMQSARSYRRALSRDEIVRVLRAFAGKQYDPRLVELVLARYDELEALAAGSDDPRFSAMREIAAIQREHALALYEERRGGVLQNIAAVRDEARMLHELASELGGCVGLTATLDAFVRRVRGLVPCEAAAVLLPDRTRGDLAVAYADGASAESLRAMRVAPGQGICALAFAERRTTAATMADDHRGAFVDLPDGLRQACRCALAVALCHDDEPVGVLALYGTTRESFGSEDERLLELVAPEAATALCAALRYEASRDSALTDALTGLPNSRFLFLQVEKEVSRARRSGRPFGLAVLDLDRFKPINDTHGHAAGDEVLRALADGIRSRLRAADTVCRWGGDEFVALLPDAEAPQVENVVRELQRFVDEFEITLSSGPVVRIGLSVGWAVFPADGSDHEELVRVADKRMYRDKSMRHATRDEPALAR